MLLERQVEAQKWDLVAHRERIAALEGDLHQVRLALSRIHTSAGWKWLCRYYNLRNALLPPGSVRWSLVRGGLGVPKITARWAKTLVKLFRRDSGRAVSALSCGSRLNDPPAPVSEEVAADPYARWIRSHEPGREELRRQAAMHFPRAPLISLLVAACDAPEPYLRATVESVVAQTYGRWELCLADDAGESPERSRLLQALGQRDGRIKVIVVPPGAGLADSANRALAASAGEYVAYIGPGDTLAPFALFETVQALRRDPGADLLYSDEDRIDEAGRERSAPLFKPDWSPDTLRSHDYVGNLAVFARPLLDRAGRVRDGFGGCWHYDLLLRATEVSRPPVHLPQILYHRRTRPGESGRTARDHEAGRRSVAEHLGRVGWEGEVRDGLLPGTYQLRQSPAPRARISVIIPNKDNAELLAGCVDSLRRSSYPDYEVLIVENGSRRADTFACYREVTTRPNVRVLVWDRPFNFAALNNEAARQASGELLLFLNNDVQPINDDWLERMADFALRAHVGAVGARLLYPDDTVQHAGMVVDRSHGTAHLFLFHPRHAPGYGGRQAVAQNLSAVTAACLLMRRQVFEEVGGFEEVFAVQYNDVDLCLKLRRKGYQVVWTPHAELYHLESATRDYNVTPEKKAACAREYDLFHARWGESLPPVDPYYNPNLMSFHPPGDPLQGSAPGGQLSAGEAA
jgi:GT2 family glycosyltransferase